MKSWSLTPFTLTKKINPPETREKRLPHTPKHVKKTQLLKMTYA